MSTILASRHFSVQRIDMISLITESEQSMNLQQLRYAVALADARSFTKAAVNEYVVQSALSQQLRKLEDELGVTLFERTTRTVAPTPAGESLLPLMRQVLAGVDQIKFDAQAISGTIAGRLTSE